VILFARILLILGALGVPGGLLFFFTGIAGIGIPLWLGCTLGIAGIINSFFAVMNGGGFAQIEATMALMNVLLTEAAEKSGTLKKQDVLAVYASMLKSNPEGTMTYYIDFLFDKATMLEKSGKKQDALNIYEAIIEINPKLYDVRDIRIMIDRVGKHHTK
jgi:tetratricopeptide (TPR) repeat protein